MDYAAWAVGTGSQSIIRNNRYDPKFKLIFGVESILLLGAFFDSAEGLFRAILKTVNEQELKR